MASFHSFNISVDLPSDNVEDLLKSLLAAGYTNPVWVDSTGVAPGQSRTTLDFQVDEDAVTFETMKADINSNYPPPGALSHNAADPLVIAGDGVATAVVTITDPRGAGAVGKVVRLEIPGGVFVKVDADSFTLDANGQQTATFGPLDGVTGNLNLKFRYANGEVSPVSLTVRFGT